ncbi:MAG: tetratricopeptide repeat protein, partial [Planctomycetaceae bacterium]
LRTAEPGRFAEAMRLIDRALLQSPDDLSLLLTKAELHLVLSELPKAQETLDRAARLAQEDPRVSALQSRLDVAESNAGLPLTSPFRLSPAQQGKSP